MTDRKKPFNNYLDITLQSDGTSLYAMGDAVNNAMDVKLIGFRFEKFEDTYADGDFIACDMQIFFDPKQWPEDDKGMLYTDKGFLNSVRNHFDLTEEDIDWSESGRQDSHFCDFDLSVSGYDKLVAAGYKPYMRLVSNPDDVVEGKYVRAKHDIQALVKVVSELITSPETAGHLDNSVQYDRFIGDLAQVVADHTGLKLFAGVSDDGAAYVEFDVEDTDGAPSPQQLFEKHVGVEWMIQSHIGSQESLVPFTGSYDEAASKARSLFPDAAVTTIEPLEDYKRRKIKVDNPDSISSIAKP